MKNNINKLNQNFFKCKNKILIKMKILAKFKMLKIYKILFKFEKTIFNIAKISANLILNINIGVTKYLISNIRVTFIQS